MRGTSSADFHDIQNGGTTVVFMTIIEEEGKGKFY